MQLDTVVNVLHSVLFVPVGWLSSILPGQGGANAAWTLLATMLITSTLASLGRRQLFMLEHMAGLRGAEKLKRRLETERTQVDHQSRDRIDTAIDRAARSTFAFRNCASFIRRCIEPFGGYFLMRHGISVRNIFTFANLALAIIIVSVGWPSLEERREWILSALMTYGRYVDRIAGLSSLVTFVIIVVTVWVFIGRTPIIDHVRARSDASAEANSRLLRISASIYDLYLDLGTWQNELRPGVELLTDEVIREASDSRFEWFGREIRGVRGVYWRGEGKHSSSTLEASAESLGDELQEMRAAGVGSVATRLTGVAGNHLEHVGISLSRGREGARFLATKLWFRQVIEKRLASAMPIFWKFDSINEEGLKDDEIDRQLEQAGRDLRASEVEILYGLELKSLHLYRAANLMERRKMGSFWVRVLSAKYGN